MYLPQRPRLFERFDRNDYFDLVYFFLKFFVYGLRIIGIRVRDTMYAT